MDVSDEDLPPQQSDSQVAEKRPLQSEDDSSDISTPMAVIERPKKKKKKYMACAIRSCGCSSTTGAYFPNPYKKRLDAEQRVTEQKRLRHWFAVCNRDESWIPTERDMIGWCHFDVKDISESRRVRMGKEEVIRRLNKNATPVRGAFPKEPRLEWRNKRKPVEACGNNVDRNVNSDSSELVLPSRDTPKAKALAIKRNYNRNVMRNASDSQAKKAGGKKLLQGRCSKHKSAKVNKRSVAVGKEVICRRKNITGKPDDAMHDAGRISNLYFDDADDGHDGATFEKACEKIIHPVSVSEPTKSAIVRLHDKMYTPDKISEWLGRQPLSANFMQLSTSDVFNYLIDNDLITASVNNLPVSSSAGRTVPVGGPRHYSRKIVNCGRLRTPQHMKAVAAVREALENLKPGEISYRRLRKATGVPEVSIARILKEDLVSDFPDHAQALSRTAFLEKAKVKRVLIQLEKERSLRTQLEVRLQDSSDSNCKKPFSDIDDALSRSRNINRVARQTSSSAVIAISGQRNADNKSSMVISDCRSTDFQQQLSDIRQALATRDVELRVACQEIERLRIENASFKQELQQHRNGALRAGVTLAAHGNFNSGFGTEVVTSAADNQHRSQRQHFAAQRPSMTAVTSSSQTSATILYPTTMPQQHVITTNGVTNMGFSEIFGQTYTMARFSA